jgi:hypothetical protein
VFNTIKKNQKKKDLLEEEVIRFDDKESYCLPFIMANVAVRNVNINLTLTENWRKIIYH